MMLNLIFRLKFFWLHIVGSNIESPVLWAGARNLSNPKVMLCLATVPSSRHLKAS